MVKKKVTKKKVARKVAKKAKRKVAKKVTRKVSKKKTAKKKMPVVRVPHGQGGLVIIDGVYYRAGKTKSKMMDGVKHADYTELEPFDPNSHAEVVDQLAELLAEKVQPKRVIEELLKDTPTENLQKLLKKIKSGQMKVKATDGCLGLTFTNKRKKKNKSSYVSIMK